MISAMIAGAIGGALFWLVCFLAITFTRGDIEDE
jgi:hypothetical protein